MRRDEFFGRVISLNGQANQMREFTLRFAEFEPDSLHVWRIASLTATRSAMGSPMWKHGEKGE